MILTEAWVRRARSQQSVKGVELRAPIPPVGRLVGRDARLAPSVPFLPHQTIRAICLSGKDREGLGIKPNLWGSLIKRSIPRRYHL